MRVYVIYHDPGDNYGSENVHLAKWRVRSGTII